MRRPHHQTVAAYLALALVLVTGTAYAAATIDSGDVINSSLKSVDLKRNAGVKGADVPADNLRGADFSKGSRAKLRGADVGANSLGGAQINEPSIVASRVIARLGGPQNQPIPSSAAVIPFANGTYTQPAEMFNELIASARITFSAACVQPRTAVVYLLADSPVIAIDNIQGVAQVSDTGAGAATKQVTFMPLLGAMRGMVEPREPASTPRTFFVYGQSGCNSGSGVTLDSLPLDVVGHR